MHAGVVPQDLGVAAVGATDQQHDVGSGREQRVQVVVAHRAGRDVHDPGPGRETHPVAGLGRHDPFVADDREPEPAAGTRAGQRRRRPGAQLGPDRVHAVHDVGAERGGVGGGAEQRTVGPPRC